jgi:hypothetical protein
LTGNQQVHKFGLFSNPTKWDYLMCELMDLVETIDLGDRTYEYKTKDEA